MRLPALWLGLALAAGIEVASLRSGSLALWIGLSVAALAMGCVAVWRGQFVAAWVLALVAWAGLGGLALKIERAVVPANHVTRLLATGRLDLSEPLRWRGRLREDPIRLPWGNRYEIDLEGLEVNGETVPVSGGLRANLYRGPRVAEPPEGLRAGDRVEVLLRARPPRNFLDPGAPDARGYLAWQHVDLIGSLRSGELLQLLDRPRPTILQECARIRGDLLERIDQLESGQARNAAVLRAMLLGDRSFIDSEVVTAFQKTSAYHVLVVAGLHVGALVVFMLWLCRRVRFPVIMTIAIALCVLAVYVAVVEDRAPILRAALMAAFYLLARPLFRRVELLNTISLAGLFLLFWRPSSLTNSSFQLSFLAAGMIAGLGVPWIERTSEPYRAGLAHLSDVTRDVAHPPRVAQFRVELRAATNWLTLRLPRWFQSHSSGVLTIPVRGGLRVWDVVVLSAVIQLGMMPSLAQEFHRVALVGPVSNIPAVLLTGVIVPLGFFCLALSFAWGRVALLLARILDACVTILLACVGWFERFPRVSYRIPGPPIWLFLAFLAALACLAALSRVEARRQRDRVVRRQPRAIVRRSEWTAAAAMAALAALVATHPFTPNLERGKLEITTLDVGQGDSIFVASPDGETMLVDGGGLAGSEWTNGHRSGPDIGEEVVSPYLWSRSLKRLDVVALTHADHDHIDGLLSVLENFRVGQLWVGRDQDKAAFRNLVAEAGSLGIPVVHQTRGSELHWGNATIEILWPEDSSETAQASNNDSLVIRLKDGSKAVLLSGDIEKPVESQLIAENASLASDFLKVPHHGSKTSSTEAFLDAVAPKLAVVSVGENNPFGHPAAVVVARYAAEGTHLLRTDRDGAVTALTDGREIWVRTFASPTSAVAALTGNPPGH